MKIKRILAALLLPALLLCGCSRGEAVPTSASTPRPTFTPLPTATPTASPVPTPDPEALAREAAERETVAAARALAAQYFYDEALALLSGTEDAGDIIREAEADIRAEKDALVPYEGELRHIFFHSLIVYPEMVFRDLHTPMGGYNSGFAEKAELERILPQLYARGYVLYDLNECYEKVGGRMRRKEILLPAGKTPLILSVDDVAYAYGVGWASRLYVDGTGALLYEVPNPQGGTDVCADGDVMGVVDAFVRAHPDFAWHGHKGTIALTGFQGAFGYPSYDDPDNARQIKAVAEALKAEGWSFASHSYTHNSGQYGFWGAGCNPANIYYDINKWVDRVTPCIGPTNLFIAPFGARVTGEALQHVLNAGFDIYCTVDSHVVNEIFDDYALMSRIEIGGYSMRKYVPLLNELFFNVDEVFDAGGRPPLAE